MTLDGCLQLPTARDLPQRLQMCLPGRSTRARDGHRRAGGLADEGFADGDVSGCLEHRHLLAQGGVRHLHGVSHFPESERAGAVESSHDRESDRILQKLVEAMTRMRLFARAHDLASRVAQAIATMKMSAEVMPDQSTEPCTQATTTMAAT